MANDRLISIQPPSHTMSNSNVANGARMWGQCPEIPQVLGCRRVPKRHADSAASRPAISRTPRQSESATLVNVATHDRYPRAPDYDLSRSRTPFPSNVSTNVRHPVPVARVSNLERRSHQMFPQRPSCRAARTDGGLSPSKSIESTLRQRPRSIRTKMAEGGKSQLRECDDLQSHQLRANRIRQLTQCAVIICRQSAPGTVRRADKSHFKPSSHFRASSSDVKTSAMEPRLAATVIPNF
jgi:hypothetical protein